MPPYYPWYLYIREGPDLVMNKVYVVEKVGLGLLGNGVRLVGHSLRTVDNSIDVGYSELLFRSLDDVQKENKAIREMIEEARRYLDEDDCGATA